jgi:hypothetical protein
MTHFGRTCASWRIFSTVSELFGIGSGENHWYGNSYFERCIFSMCRAMILPLTFCRVEGALGARIFFAALNP